MRPKAHQVSKTRCGALATLWWIWSEIPKVLSQEFLINDFNLPIRGEILKVEHLLLIHMVTGRFNLSYSAIFLNSHSNLKQYHGMNMKHRDFSLEYSPLSLQENRCWYFFKYKNV